ncbi:hypothetical protein NGB24_07175 [Mammaliicoccus vitulinus]|uniref:hypothetical protein n=1 Tax=Mammaliicoccus vitulinus TaxID=71237 RepID=UPI002DB658B6|nr:hypothetical protein [Mammaliicoccus vitulinus]MEB7657634.1 hypothetical protein [Mammaliicoccus vitulinus]
MEFKNIINDTKVSQTVDKLNNIEGLNNKFIYIYNEMDDWYDIIHSVENLIQTSDVVAMQINEILVENLIKEGIINFSIYEDKELLNENALTFIQQPSVNIYGSKIINQFNIGVLEDFSANRTKTLEYA